MKNVFIFLFLLILCSGIAAAANIVNTEYAENSITHYYDNGQVNVTTYGAQAYAREDGRWKEMNDLKSWKGTSYECRVDYDGQNDVECLDFNATSKTITLKQTEKTKSKEDIPIRVWKENKDTKEKVYSLETTSEFLPTTVKKQMVIKAKPSEVIEIGAHSTQVYTYTASSTDDVNCMVNGATYTYNSVSTEGVIGTTSGGIKFYNGMRYPNVNVPKDATIIAATLGFTADANSLSNQVDAEIYLELKGDTPTFLSTDANCAQFFDRSWTTNTTNTSMVWWDIEDWYLNDEYSTQGISTPVETITNLSTWAAGNAITAFAYTAPSSDLGVLRTFHSYDDGDPGYNPYIAITYEGGVTTTTTTTTTSTSGTTTTTIPACTDTDSGINATVEGMTYWDLYPQYNISDACLNSTDLQETYCYLGDPTLINIACDSVDLQYCNNNVCSNSTPSNASICIDTDGGYTSMVYGWAQNGGDIDTDACQDTNTLLEAYCPSVNGTPSVIEIDCSNVWGGITYVGCQNGVCVTAFNSTLDCIDSDDGYNTPVFGYTLKYVGGVLIYQEDVCVDSETLNEGYCTGGADIPAYSAINCTNTWGGVTYNGCAAGVCVPGALPPGGTATDNTIIDFFNDFGGDYGIPNIVIWLILMLIVGGAILWQTNGGAHGFLLLIFAEIIMIVLGAVMGMISTGIIIILIVTAVGIGVLWARKALIGGG